MKKVACYVYYSCLSISPERMRRNVMRRVKLQSAMEYLMTYGWAILIISVVLGVLFQMGAFNSSSVTVRVPAGTCTVLRTSAAVNLVGQCSGILPKYVAQFNGQSSINVGNGANLAVTTKPFTFEAWANPNATDSGYGWVVGKTGYHMGIYRLGSTWYFGMWNSGGNFYSSSWMGITPNSWYNLVGTFNSLGCMTLYVNSVQQPSSSCITPIYYGAQTYIGTPTGSNLYFNGLISNVQIYNTSLDASQVLALYQEGIGGAPVAPSNIVGWWPLNGDAKDYSGNNNNGAPTAVTYVSQYGK
jgi:hypothetical protein